MPHRTYKANTWPDIVRLYSSVVASGAGRQFQPVLGLLEQIAASCYACGLHGNKSMWDLLIVQTPEYDPDGEVLRIAYDPALREFTFELQETTSTLYKRWSKKCPPDESFATFERFLHLKKWFVEEKTVGR